VNGVEATTILGNVGTLVRWLFQHKNVNY